MSSESQRIQLYYWPTPNGHKVPIFLEEAQLDYELVPVNINKGEQFEVEFLAVSPNNKIPALVDPHGPGDKPLALFESGAILIYLAEKTGRFLPREGAGRYQVLQWLMFQMGSVGPMFGQLGHFLGYAPEPVPYATQRYDKETRRLYGVLETQLESHEHLAGEYSIADMAVLPWVHVHWFHKIELDEYPAVHRWYRRLLERPAVQRAFALLADKMKIGDPDETTREMFFGDSQYAAAGRRKGQAEGNA
ncbi:MAG: glutathione S-transferase N-terminal domain-containing protein [Gammaproteobacteria bacterium]|nr:glutathione S-transferase N-terminal domain-containing protein [Gammaproteobacteria bacterium]